MKKILRIILILSLLSLFTFLGQDFKIPKAQAGEVLLDNSITKPYYLNQSGTTYKLTADITADGTAFIVDGDNITLDLNNHKVVFGNVNATGIPNADFEEGTGTTPTHWDLSLAPNAKRAPTSEMPLVGNWLLKFDQPPATQEIISDWVNLPQGNRTYMGMVIVKSCWGCMHRIKVEAEDGTIVSEASSDNVERAPMITTQFKPATAGNYRLRIAFENPAGRSSWIDYADIRPAYDSGIVMRTYFDAIRTPDLVGMPNPGTHKNIVIKNGRIVEGAGKGVKYRAIHKSDSGYLEVDHVYTEVSGIDASNFWGEYSSNTVIHDSNFTNHAAYVINRMALDNFPVYIGSDSKFYNNTIEGGQGGVSTLGFSNIEIYNNTFRINATVSNHYAVTTYKSDNITVHHNRFESGIGPGIMFSSQTANSTIHDNYFNITAMPCDGEYETSLTTPVIRITDYQAGNTINNKIYNNMIIGTAPDYSSQFPRCTPTIIGLRMDHSGSGNEYFNNTVKVMAASSKSVAQGIKWGSINPTNITNNYIESNNLNMWMGTDYTACSDGNFVSNTFVKGANPIDYHTFRIGYCCGINAENNTFLDTTFANGASMDNIIWGVGSGGGAYSYTMKWYLNIKVTDGTTPITSAQVNINDKDNQSVFSGITDAGGKINNIVLNQFYRSGNVLPFSSSYTYSTPHTITISKSGYPTETKTITMDSSKEMTVILDGTDNEPPIISNVMASNITQSSATISWQTDREADSKVEYGLDTNYGTTLTEANLTTNHSINLSGLFPTTYHFRVTSKDASGKENVGGDHTFFILPLGVSSVSLTKSVDKISASSGEILTYTINYTANKDILNAILEDLIPNGTTYVANSATGGATFDGTKVIWNLGNLAPGATGSVQFQVRVE